MFGSLALSKALSSQAVAIMPTWRSISPGEVLSLAHKQAIGCSNSAPQSGTCGAQIGAVLGFFSKCQPALMVSIIYRPGQWLGQWLRFDWFIKQALTMAIVQEGGDHESRARGPWLLLVQVGQG